MLFSSTSKWNIKECVLDLVLYIFEAKNHTSLKICCFSSECSNNRDLKKEGMIKHEKKRWTSDKHFIKLTLSCFATTVHFILQQFSKSILIICSLKALCTTKHISVLKPFEQDIKNLQSFSPRNAQKHIFPFPLQDYHKSLATASCSGHHKYSFAKSLTISYFLDALASLKTMFKIKKATFSRFCHLLSVITLPQHCLKGLNFFILS